MRRFWIPPIFAVIGLLAGVIYVLLVPAEYVSKATMQVSQVQISDRFVPGVRPLDGAVFVRGAAQMALSRSSLTTLIQAYELYRSERERLPMEDVIETFRKQVRMQATPAGGIEVEFRYPDRYKAQTVVAQLTTKLIDESIRHASSLQKGTVDFLTDSADRAAAEWRQADEAVRKSPKPDEILAMNRDLARKQYVELKTKLAEALLVDELVKRRFTPSLEMLDPASLPESTETNPYLTVAGTTLAGLVFGLLVVVSLRFRRMAPNPEPALA